MEEKNEQAEATLRKFWISDCPEEVYQRFVKFCLKETNNGYAMGVKLLLDAYDKNAVEMMMYERLCKLEDEVDALKKSKS